MSCRDSTVGRGPARDLRRQAGSTYLLALLALVVLSLVGLSLGLVTQTEMAIGGNEMVVQRVFYAADSGLSMAAARALVEADYAAHAYRLPEAPGQGIDLGFVHDVDVSPFFPILQVACNLCEINHEGEYGSRPYKRINHAVTAVARRITTTDETLRGEKMVATMVDVQPWQPSTEALLPLDDPEALAKLRF